LLQTAVGMKRYFAYVIIFLCTLQFSVCRAQSSDASNIIVKENRLFSDDKPLPLELSFSIKEMRKESNDSTYINLPLKYKTTPNDDWNEIPTRLRARGNFRLENCYFPPLKVKIKKKLTKGTLFEGNKTLKMVLPCLKEKDNNDNVIKEYLAYKMYEILSPYHFKTRLLDITLIESRGNKVREHQLKGFFIEDDKKVAKRSNAKVYKNNNHPLNHEPVSSVRNVMFQCMIGNTDFSSAYQHNCKVIYVDTDIIPVPYDFDMSGFVDASYAVVSQIKGESLKMTSVSERLYRGFERENPVFEQVRNEFLEKRQAIVELLDDHELYFENTREFIAAKEYILSFFMILEDEEKFKKTITEKARKG